MTEVVDLATGMYKVKIPNYEIKFFIQKHNKDWFNDKVIGMQSNNKKIVVTLKVDEVEKNLKVVELKCSVI